MPKGKSLSPQDIISNIEAYNKTKSVWKAAAITGFSGQAIHTTLRKLDLIQYPNFSEAEIEEIKIEYTKELLNDLIHLLDIKTEYEIKDLS